MHLNPAQHLHHGVIVCALIASVFGQPSVAEENIADEAVDFVRDIRPLLADRCFACHGPDTDARQAELRLDVRERAIVNAITPGSAADSELVLRITSDDPEQRMPPADANKPPITEDEAELIGRWIDQGAEYATHWAFHAVASPSVPELAGGDRNPIDAFIRQRLQHGGLQRSSVADRRTLIRRISFDLTGLPPTADQVRDFVNDAAPDAYEQLVDRLLDSPHYGERMAQYWLDVVRYADTNGIHNDVHRDHASFRDYVIKAFNENLPYDRFVIEQLAGDLLPEATVEQKIASGFNRLNMTTEEGGAQPKEYMAIYAADRVRNTGSIFMGTTIGCAQCHDHKFDPFTTRDFYSLAAFFADVQETAVGKQQSVTLPRIAHDEADAARLDALRSRIAAEQLRLDKATPELEAAQAEWEPLAREQALHSPTLGNWSSVGPFIAEDSAAAFRTEYVDEKSENVDRSATYQDGQLAWKEQKEWSDGAIHKLTGENAATYLVRTIHAHVEQQLELSLGSDDGIRVWLNGQLVLEDEVFRSLAADQTRVTVQLRPGDNQLLVKIVNKGGDYGFYFQAIGLSEFPGVDEILRTAPADRNDEQRGKLAAYYRSIAPSLAATREEMKLLQEQGTELNADLLILVSNSVEPRMVRILPRGNWLDESGEVVQPAPPAFLGNWSVEDRRATRKDLADWLVSSDNPLTARVFVNRLWKLAFGHGLVRSLDDFGAQGETASHPQLLDWLAESFIGSGWNVKQMMKLLVMSATYRQSSMASTALAAADPLNNLFARQSRFRLDAEMIRDNALSVSGLLVRRIGGLSVKPYQPSGYWAHLHFPAREWEHGHGENLYRRGLYTYWCRTFLHPAMLAFDAPTREECTVERPRSNTPLAALVLLNDPCYVEAARALAAIVLERGGSDTATRVRFAFDQVLHRTPADSEAGVLISLYEKHLAAYQADAEAAAATQTVGESPLPDGVDLAELAAWTSVARTLLNLHETITRY